MFTIEDISNQSSQSFLLAKIHKDNYPSIHFSSHLPLSVLNDLYLSFFGNSLILIAKDNNIPCGFVIGGKKEDIFFKYSYISYLKILLAYILNPIFLINKVLSLISPNNNFKSCSTRIFSICISSNYSKSGLGTLLINKIEKEFKENGVTCYGLSVNSKNYIAIKFYNKNGFQKLRKNGQNIFFEKSLSN